MRTNVFIIALAILAAFECQLVKSAKILAIFSFPGRSQYIFAENYLKALAARGHEVTVINTFGSKEQLKNFRVIGATKLHDLFPGFDINYEVNGSQWSWLSASTDFLNFLTWNIFNEAAVQQLLQSDEKFDLLLAECVQTDVLYGFAQHFGALTIGFSSFGTDQYIDELVANISPLSYNPTILSSRTDRMSFRERLVNLKEISINWLYRRLVHLPVQAQLYKQYFPNATKPFAAVLDDFSLILVGQHFTLSHARPYLPNMIEVGGMHLSQETQALPTHIQSFIDESQHGVIYFSMGSNLMSKDLPAATRTAILQVFGGLKQRVLWKFEDDHLPDKPANVLISKWFPQADILAHAKVRVFITHGGLLSSIESLYYGKPLLGLPVFWDQFLNVERAKSAGYGLSLDWKTLTAEELQHKLDRLLNDDNFVQKAKQISKRFRDQPESALERAIWWTEYVLRHKGASHMRASAKDLNLAQLHSLDTICTLFGGLALCTCSVVFVLYKLVRVMRERCTGANKLKKP